MFAVHWEKDDKKEGYNNEEKGDDVTEQSDFLPLSGYTYNRGFPSCGGNHYLCGGG